MIKKSLTFIFLIIGFLSFSQTNSPYSYFGMGDVAENEYTFNTLMGGAGVAYSDSAKVNRLNPASLSRLSNTVLHTGVAYKGVNLKTNDKTQQYGDGWLPYFGIGFPVLKNKLGFSGGLSPLSSSNFTIVDSIYEPNVGDVSYLHTGSGRYYQAFYDMGLQLLPKKWSTKHRMSIGFGGAYYFGSMERQTRTEFNDTLYFFNSRRIEQSYLNDFYWHSGIHYNLNFSEKEDKHMQFGMGFCWDNGKNLKVNRNIYWDRYQYNNTSIDIKDTVQITSEQSGSIYYPEGFSIGLSLSRISKLNLGKITQWHLFVDYKNRKWSNYKYFNESINLNDSYQISIGAQASPKTANQTKPLHFYFGGYFGEEYLFVKNQKVSSFGMSFGIGVPFKELPGKPGNSSILNIGLTLGKRGNKDIGIIEEQFIKINLGILMNSRWFIKRKFI